MGHLSLYRAFRPKSFDEMVRQEHVVRILKNQIQTDSVGHAYLFCGPRGTGKTSVARILARAVNCENPVGGSPCGTCDTCRALSEGGNLDVTEIDAASNNGVNEMRDLREKVQYPPVSGKYKVYIIDEVHMLTDSAFNALLKTLEEPPRHAIFILATTEPQKIPATILSRCMRLDFKLIPESDLAAHLKRILDGMGKHYEEEAVSAIARAGAGSDRDMLSIAEMCLSYSDKLTYEGVMSVLGAADFGQMSDLCGAILSSDMPRAISLTEQILSEGKSVGVLLRDILQFFNRAAIAKTCRNAESILSLPKDVFAKIAKIAKEADGHAILRSTEIFAKTESELRFSASPRICLETAIVKAAMPSQDYDIEALLARISKLEKQVAELSAGKVVVQSAPSALPVEEVREDAMQEDFPMEEPVFAEAYFAEEPVYEPVRAPKREKVEVSEQNVEPAPVAEKPQPAPPSGMTADQIFGKFARAMRKEGGLMHALCYDLEPVFEGGMLVFYTEVDTVHRSLNEESRRVKIAGILQELGVTQFEVRLKGKENRYAAEKQGIEKLKQDFPDYPIEIK